MPPRRASDLPFETRAELIRHSNLGAEISAPVIDRLAASALAVDYRRRRFIYRTGDAPEAVYLIIRGWVKLCCVDAETSREAVIDILSPGAMFGESALYHSHLREKSAITYSNSRVLRLPVEDFRSAMDEHRELYDYTFRLVGQRLANAERRLADFALDAIPARLEKLLLELSKRYGVRSYNGVLIDLPLPHREIASIVGSTRESITVRLNAMRREGIIDIVDRKILVKLPEALVAA
ncbi:MAG TPA: Crp/Fnr family transcriptional regulator [Pyrinomonadaceae bacterium]|jgi:CRP-like cAMP-binding protein|nr:Crp/Fnr family transcriptional regulator [Pyrinomonadaceae bacterium]